MSGLLTAVTSTCAYKHLFDQDAAKQAERERQRDTAQPLRTNPAVTSILQPLGQPQLELVPVPVGAGGPAVPQEPEAITPTPVRTGSHLLLKRAFQLPTPWRQRGDFKSTNTRLEG